MTITKPEHPTESTDEQPTRARRWPRRVAIALAIAIVVLVGAWLALGWVQPHPYSGTVMQAPTAAPSMDGLLLSDGTPVDLAAYEGDLLLVYFGYTACPDVCPTTLAQIASARRQLGDDTDRVRVLLVTIDPERDSLDGLGGYVEAFDPTFEAAGGDLADIQRVAAQYGIYFAKGDPLGDGYAMDHTATVMGIDPDGHLRIVWAPPLDVDRLADDLAALL